MSLSYWNKFDKRNNKKEKKKYIDGGYKYVDCQKKKGNLRSFMSSFDLLLNALNEKGGNESRRED